MKNDKNDYWRFVKVQCTKCRDLERGGRKMCLDCGQRGWNWLNIREAAHIPKTNMFEYPVTETTDKSGNVRYRTKSGRLLTLAQCEMKYLRTIKK